MGPDLQKVLNEFTLRMRLMRAFFQEQTGEETLSERETLILQQLAERGPLSVSQISENWPNVSDSTISMAVTKLWRDRGLVTKTIHPSNQRITMVGLSEKGKKELDAIMKQRNERFQMFFEAINVSEEEKEVLIRIFRRGVQYMDKMLGFENKASDTQVSKKE